MSKASCPIGWMDTGDNGSTLRFLPNTSGTPGAEELLLGDGSRRYWAVTSVDIDADGKKDVVVRDAYAGAALVEEPLSLSVFEPGLGMRSLAVEGSEIHPSAFGFSAVGDFDGDGLADLQADGTVYLSGSTVTESEWSCRSGLLVGDVDGDGLLDSVCQNDEVILRFGGRDESRTLEISSDVGIKMVGDLDGDGVQELVFRDDVTFENVILNLVGLSRRAVDSLPDGVGDVDGDGLDDLSVNPESSSYFLLRSGASEQDDEPYGTTGQSWLTPTPAGDANCDGFGDVFVEDGLGRTSRLRLGSDEGIGEEVWSSHHVALVPVYE